MRWRRGEPDERWDEEETVEGWEERPAAMSTGALANASTVLRWLAWSLVVAGPVLGLLALTGSSQPDAAPQREREPQRQVVVPDEAGPAGFGEMFVVAYLRAGEGEEKALAAYYPDVVSLRLPGESESVRAEHAAAVRVEDVAPDYWSVTVGVRVASPAPAKSAGGSKEKPQTSTLRYFQVPVRSDSSGPGERYVAASLPAEVSVPPAADAGPELDYGRPGPVREGDPVAEALQEFFSSYLTGGELDRYLSPGTSMAPVTPAPYEQVRIAQLAVHGSDDADAGSEDPDPPADGERREVLVDVEAAAEAGQWRPMTYALSLTARDGRWEVRALEAAPALAGVESAQREAGKGVAR